MPGEMLFEEVARFKSRQGDVVFSGRNNATVVLGRDRLSAVDSGHSDEPGSGAITIVVGRRGEDPSLANDSATLYVSMKSSPDQELSTTGPSGRSVAVARADRIILAARDQAIVKVGSATITVSSDGTIVVEGDVRLGAGASDRLLKEPFASWATNHVHPDPASGFTGKPTVPPPQSSYSSRGRSL